MVTREKKFRRVYVGINLTNRKLLECLCDRNMNDVISARKIHSENTRRSRAFSGNFLVEMASFMFLSQYRDTKAIFYLFYKITKVFSSFRDVIHVSVL